MEIGKQKSVILNDILYDEVYQTTAGELSENYLTTRHNFDKSHILEEFIEQPVFNQITIKYQSIIRLVCDESLIEWDTDMDE